MSTKKSHVMGWLGVVLAIMLALLSWVRPVAAATMIDIMFVYDTTATSWVSSKGGMTAFSQDTVNRMNQALQNSGVDLTFRLVHAMNINYTTASGPSSPLSTDLYALQAGSGVFAAVHTARNTYGADLVAMLVDHGSAYGYVGIGYLLTSWLGSPNYGFTVNAIRSVEISHTLTHEVGHNLGAHHSKSQAQDPGPNYFLSSYSAGWYFNGTNSVSYHTIMAYNSDGYGHTYQPAPLFSTPLRTFQGTTAGHAQNGDNARLIRLTMDVVASYRNEASGSVTVTLGPAAAITAGAQWRVNGGAWQNSGATVSGVYNSQLIEFKSISHLTQGKIWGTPPAQTVLLSDGVMITAGTYIEYDYIERSNSADLGDFNADGKADILWRHATTGNNSMWLMNGTARRSDSSLIDAVADLNWQVVP